MDYVPRFAPGHRRQEREIIFFFSLELYLNATRKMTNLVCVEDYEKYAMNNLPPSVRDYYKSGAGEEHSLRWNREAFRRYRVRPKFLRDVSKRDTSTTVLGEKISMPLGVAPTAMQRMAHPDGECANVRVLNAAVGIKAHGR
ncbi:hypothetical protein KPH14_009664 [Odynerus spinipes]|uniref:FMN hydroxy acid dehydrogenase domain-containing protein n=1 Tax=Odynerus spinipes TaxID=1348599 RepID=A0AAD9RQ33_9HYME|nr:hypothetical protein KPH14_009664 [Odynerus spinipes]